MDTLRTEKLHEEILAIPQQIGPEQLRAQLRLAKMFADQPGTGVSSRTGGRWEPTDEAMAPGIAIHPPGTTPPQPEQSIIFPPEMIQKVVGPRPGIIFAPEPGTTPPQPEQSIILTPEMIQKVVGPGPGTTLTPEMIREARAALSKIRITSEDQVSKPPDPKALPRQSGPAHTDRVSPKITEIPIDRGLELNQEIKKCRAALTKQRDILRILEDQINTAGGRRRAPAPLVSECDDVEQEVKRLDQTANALETERRFQRRYEVELCAFTFALEELAITGGYEPPCAADVLALADTACPGIFTEKSIMLRLSPTYLASKFREANTVDAEIAQLEEIASAHPMTQLIRQRLQSLYAVKQILDSSDSHSSPVSSWQLYTPDVDLLRLSDNALKTTDLMLGEQWHLRISVFRMSDTDRGENEATGAVVFRETYAMGTTEMARVAITYYNPSRSGRFSLSDNHELTRNLLRLQGRLCQFCKGELRKETSEYRLPPCILFLRFYDETEQLDDRFQTTRLHTPLCMALDSGVLTDSGENVLSETGALYNCSVPSWVFGELFKRQMVGSYWLDQEHLQQLYRILREDLPEEIGFVLHSQIRNLGPAHREPLGPPTSGSPTDGQSDQGAFFVESMYQKVQEGRLSASGLGESSRSAASRSEPLTETHYTPSGDLGQSRRRVPQQSRRDVSLGG